MLMLIFIACTVTVLDHASAGDAIHPFPKLYDHEKNRKDDMSPLITEAKHVVDPVVNSMSKTLLRPEGISCFPFSSLHFACYHTLLFILAWHLLLMFTPFQTVYPVEMEEANLTSIEDHLRAAGILGAKDNCILNRDPRNPVDIAINADMASGAQFSFDVNMPTKKVCAQPWQASYVKCLNVKLLFV